MMNIIFMNERMVCYVFIPLAGFEFLSSVAMGLTPISPLGVLGTLIAITFYDQPQWSPAKPKRFAWCIGLLLVFLCLLWVIILGKETLLGAYKPLFLATVVICNIATGLEASLGFCLGCYIYNKIIVPMFKLEECEDCKM